jgi:hypothetical protein
MHLLGDHMVKLIVPIGIDLLLLLLLLQGVFVHGQPAAGCQVLL